nr:glycosyltransferase family A protein [Cohnella sp. WQ 127256]
MRSSFMDNIFQNYDQQRGRNKEMIIVLNRDDMDIEKWKARAKEYRDVTVYQVSEKYKLGKCLNFGIKKAKYDIIAKFDDDDYYAPYYLRESLHALKNKKASIVGKHTSYLYFEKHKALMLYREGVENQYCRKVKGGTLVFKRSVWKRIRFNEEVASGSDVNFLRECKNRGYRVFSVSKFNYVCVRREDTSTHTQKIETKEYMDKCKWITHTKNYIPIIKKTIR